MERSSLLIADGNRDACSHLKLLFSEMFGSIDCAADGIAAIKLFRRHVYHLVILDAMLPVADGRTVCRQICKMSDVPVVIISERSALPERLSVYRSGAEDYIVKTFEGDELLARMNIILRRREHVPAKPPRALIFFGLYIDTRSRTVYVNDIPVPLTPKEYDLLLLLSRNPGQVYTREMLIDIVWGDDFFGSPRTVDTHIKTLRNAIRPYHEHIVTIRGVGYRFDE